MPNALTPRISSGGAVRTESIMSEAVKQSRLMFLDVICKVGGAGL